MKMTTRVAFDNMKYHKSKNLLTGIAIILTTLLLFVVPTVGKGMLDLQYAAVNQLYPAWYALYRNVDEETAGKLAAHHDISTYGLRSDVGIINLEDAQTSMMYMDKEGFELYKIRLAEGKLPEAEDEIVVSPGMLKELGQQGEIGDIIHVPCQIYQNGELDYSQEREFRISGFLEETEQNQEQKVYTAFISEAFLKNEIPEEQIMYRFLFQVNGTKKETTDEIKGQIHQIAEQFGIPENDININEDYLGANYVDPAVLPVIIMIMVIIMLAGAITVYSIYYVSMNQRVQEFGRLKAIGATKKQVKQIVLREGLFVAVFAIPAGLVTGTAVSRLVLQEFFKFAGSDVEFVNVAKQILQNGEVNLYYWWAYLLAIVVTLCTVYLSLMKPMRTAAKISEVEAMRYQDTGSKKKSREKGYRYLTIGRLTRRNLAGNKKKSAATILAMAITGVFLMVVATVLSCANPTESADGSVLGQYEISPIVEENNKEHPERKWSKIQINNPLNDELKQQIENLDGVENVVPFTTVRVSGKEFDDGDYNYINGIPENFAEDIEKGITEGKVTYEELKSGDKVVIDKTLLHWYPDLSVGDQLNLTVFDGDRTFEKKVEIAAIGDYSYGMVNFDCLIMAKEAADRLCENNSTGYYHIFADKNYDPELEKSLQSLLDASGRLQMRTWKEEYDNWDTALTMTRGACYAFLVILAVISVMNLINTMINSVHVRKKELGMMQAIGMSDKQLMKMLQLEGMFYTLGTLIISVGLGSLAGYPVFLYAKSHGMFGITNYHYPVTASVTIAVVLLLIQVLLAGGIAKSVKKDSLIERIRFSE